MSKVSIIIRRIFLVVLIFAAVFLCVFRLIRMQVVEGEVYLAMTESSYTAAQEIIATRGQIFDNNGKLMTTNRPVYKIIFQKAFLPYYSQNEIILKALSVLEKNGEQWNDSVPMTREEAFRFEAQNDEVIHAFKCFIIVNADATPDNCINALARKYDIDVDKYTKEQIRAIGGVRYEMEKKDFSYENRFTLADDVSIETVTQIKELGIKLSGVDAVEESARDYVITGTAPHVLGSVGAISAEEYKNLKADGYSYNDTIGKYGIESAMESVLRGSNGERSITRNSKGEVVSDEITKSVSAGNSVKLTFNTEDQNTLQEILKNQINWLNNTADRGQSCDAGAVVVLNAKTGAVLGMATYPSYDLLQSVEDYESVIALPGSPMVNRCTNGLYRPGSAFKTITAADGLINGLIDKSTPGICTGVYRFYSDYQPRCTGYHYGYNVVNCLKWSCNIFFYDLGRRLGIDELSSFAMRFGYGQDLGLEIGGSAGQMSTPELYSKLRGGEEWGSGNTLQAAIGQMDTLITPLHLAVQALTLANDGVRYKPYVVDSVWNYDMTEMLYKTEPQVAEVIEDRNNAFSIVREGMIAVSTLVNWPTSSALWHFSGLPSGVAIKTGTPEAGGGEYNSTVMGYYPADDPQIAFGVVLEKGEYSRYMVRNLIDLYIFHDYQPDISDDGVILTPWKRR